MHKKAVLAAVITPLYFMVKPHCSNNVINACNVKGHLFGKLNIIAIGSFNIGLIYGWLKTILLDNCTNYPDTALLRSAGSRTTGLTKTRNIGSISLRSSI